MLWNREQLPPELKDKKPEEILEALKRLEELEARSKQFDTTQSELETKLSNLGTEVEQMRNKLQEFEQASAQQQAQPYMQQQQQQQEPTSIWNDPDRYINEKMMNTNLGLLAAKRDTAKLLIERNLSPRDQKIYRKYEKEVDRAMEGYNWAQQGDPNCWSTALTLIRGYHDQDIAKLESTDSSFFSEPAARGRPDDTTEQPADKLTAEEEEVCRRFHWDPAGYLKRKKEMVTAQSEKGAYARFTVPERRRNAE